MISSATASQELQGIGAQSGQDLVNFAGPALFPIFRTPDVSAHYLYHDQATGLDIPRGIRLAPGIKFPRSQPKVSEETFHCQPYGVEEPISTHQVARYSGKNGAVDSAKRRAANIVQANHELRAQVKATGATVPTATPAVKWNAANSDPIEDVRAARQAVFEGCGFTANVMVCSWVVYEVLKQHPLIREVITIGSRDARWPELLANLFDVERFVPASGAVNGAHEGQAIDITEIWSDGVILARTDFTEDLARPSFGRTFLHVPESNVNPVAPELPRAASLSDEPSAPGIQLSEYTEWKIDSQVVRAKQLTAEVLTAPSAGYYLSDVLA